MRWTGLVGVVVALAGLGCSDADVSAVAQPVERVFDYSLGPESLDLGQLAVGERATATMEVANNGNTDVLITSVTAPKHPELRFLVGKVALGAGQTLPILVEWEPDTPGRLDGAVRVEIGPSPDELEVVRIPLAGSATGPLLALNVSEHDFGEVPLGCVTELNLTVSNAGNEPMRVDSVTLGGDSALSLQGLDPLPWHVPPFGSAQFSVEYAPTDAVGNLANLVVSTDAGQAHAAISGSGITEFETTIEQRVVHGVPTTMIVHVNEMMIPGLWGWGHYATAFEDSLPTLFEALQDSGVPYRVAFVYDPTGVVHGRVPYIDETSSPASAAAIAMDQLKSATGSTDNDSSLDTLIAALTKNSDWLFEDEAWAGSKLALVSLNADDEWSTIDAPTAVSMARDLKEDDANVVFHSIAGLGSGCAVPHGPYKDAVDLTGGVAADVCDTEWHGHMEKIVAGSVVGGLKNGAIYIPLSGTPLVSSIRVQVDRADLPANWWYDASSNAVIFDPRFRIPGKELAVTYRGASTCGAR